MSELIAFCGVDCSKCSDFSKLCPSCRKTVWKDGDECMPVACCRKKKISCCGECGAFPCRDMEAFYKESESHETAFALMCAVKRGEKRFQTKE